MKWTYFDTTQWHRWFAWHPVQIESHQMVWLETIERRQARFGSETYSMNPSWYYRAIAQGGA